MGIRDTLSNRLRVYGVDTETYNDPSFGLKSIQVYGSDQQHYFTVDDWTETDIEIRHKIAKQYVDWLDNLNNPSVMAFFNINYDFSQFAHYLLVESQYKYVEHDHQLRNREIRVLESERQLYKVELVNNNGKRITFVDIANFLTATNLNKACKDWIGKQKIDIGSKDFLKSAPTELEKEYAIMDAQLTYELYNKLVSEGVIEKGTVTIAGRTIKHFTHYLKENWCQSFNQWAYGTDDKELIELYSWQCEQWFRPSTRGGECQAVHKGMFHDCHHIDARSMYPTQMNRDFIPHGPILFEKPDHPHFTIYYPVGYFILKKDKIPYLQFRRKSQCIQYSFKHTYEPGQYVEDCYLDGSYALWDAELEIVKECYEFIEVDLSKQIYIAKVENRALKEYINILYEGKKNNTGTKRYYFKILLNSLYGKFLSRPDGVIISYANGERTKVEDNDRLTYYLPLGMWIAMMGRVTLHKVMLQIPYQNVLYCDTDSVIYYGDVHPNVHIGPDLGDWSVENDHFQANIVGPKTYQELSQDGSVITKCAGLSTVILPTLKYGELELGSKYTVLKSQRDKEYWNINLIKTTFEITAKLNVLREH